MPRGTKQQSALTASTVSVAAVAGRVAEAAGLRPPWWAVGLVGAAALPRAYAHHSVQRTGYSQWPQRSQNMVVATSVGVGAGLAVAALPDLTVRAVGAGGRAAARRWDGSPALWSAGLLAAAAAGGALVGKTAWRRLHTSLVADGVRPDAALTDPPGDPYVSGGPASLVAYGTLARDGRRFVSFRTPAAQIADTCPDEPVQEPIRVFVGLASADSVAARVDLAMTELERFGAFDRSTLLIAVPAGSGYANYVAVEAVECLARGDCAAVCIQYGLLPSMFSLGRVDLGAQTVRALIDRVEQRLAGRAQRPRVVMYGESLGAKVAQRALQATPGMVDAAGCVRSVDALLSVGTPGGRSLRTDRLGDPGSVFLDRWQQVPRLAGPAALWFLDHDADPVNTWDMSVAWRRPEWLRRRPRGRNVPDEMGWLPLLTWWQMVFDVTFAAQQQSGDFRSVGHDYRADLTRVVAAACFPGADVEVQAIEDLLSARERRRDAVIGVPPETFIPPE